jgi:uncharacterized protein YndB with AHSA1/START domain
VEVVREVELESPPDEVWEALTDEGRLEEWFANEVELDPRPGGEGRFRWANGEERTARVERVEPGRLLSFRWSGDGREDECVVAIALERVPAGTRVRVTETVAEWSLALELRALTTLAVA